MPDLKVFKSETRRIQNYQDDDGIFSLTKSFKIPCFQRKFNWDDKNVKSLIENICDTIQPLEDRNQNDASYINNMLFLGSTILTREQNAVDIMKEDSNSFLVIDGQQRLTTLSLISMCCAHLNDILYNELLTIIDKEEEISELRGDIRNFFEIRFQKIKKGLKNNIVSGVISDNTIIYFPKIVRQRNIGDNKEDYRDENGEYISAIALFQDSFYKGNAQDFKGITNLGADKDADNEKLRINQIWTLIKKTITDILRDEYNSEHPVSLPAIENYKKVALKEFFNVNDKEQSTFDKILNIDDFSPYLKLILFTQFLLKNVILNEIICPNEEYAYTIFEALNTTGRPLTAIETLKPLIIDIETKNNDDKALLLSLHSTFSNVEKYIDKTYFKITEQEFTIKKRETISTQIVLAFNQYRTGEKSSIKLPTQRSYLRKIQTYKTIAEKQEFVSGLEKICDFRKNFWDDKNINFINPDTHGQDGKYAKVSIAFLRAMKKTLTIPILTRIYENNKSHNAPTSTFFQYTKALVAFTVLRRAYTGGTQSIDKEYYKLLKADNALSELNLFKGKLKSLLHKKVGDKKDWLNKAKVNGLYNENSALCRFILLSASEDSEDSGHENNKITETSRNNSEMKFLNFENWNSEAYETVEHIAPQNPEDVDEDSKTIKSNSLTDTIGNLTLIPQCLNSALSNSNWDLKTQYFKAVATCDKNMCETIVKQILSDAEGSNKKYPLEILDNNVLPFLENLHNNNNWNATIVRDRSENILDRAWDNLYIWLE